MGPRRELDQRRRGGHPPESGPVRHQPRAGRGRLRRVGTLRRAAFLQRLAVHPTAQGRGLGHALVLDSIGWARRWRCRTMAVNTQDDNNTARTLYERVGFVARNHGLVVLERPMEPAS